MAKIPAVDGRRTSVVEVAALAGVSLGTVSNVLNRPERVSPATRAKVEKAMMDLGFVRNESARLLRAGKSHTLAYVMLDASNPFFTDVARGIELAADSSGFELFMCNSSESTDREDRYVDSLQQLRVAGILITPVNPDSPALTTAVERGTPVVIVDRARKDKLSCSVSVDDVHGGWLAGRHLLDQGHTRVAFIGGPPELGQVRERLEGLHQAWEEAGLPAEQVVTLPTSALTVNEGHHAGERLIGLPTASRPTAAFCANDLVALGLLRMAIGSGVRVPEDLAIVGFDDIDFAAAAAVPLTSVRQPRVELGRRAAELLIDEAASSTHTHEQVVFVPELVARASTRS